MKKCSKCKEEKSIEDFPKRAKSKDGLASVCKVCKRAYDNAHYKANPYRREYIRENSRKHVQVCQRWVLAYLQTHPCVDCDESDVVVLEFDHRGDKHDSVSMLVRAGNLQKVQTEVTKCDVRCANCHRRKTAKDFGFWKLAGIV